MKQTLLTFCILHTAFCIVFAPLARADAEAVSATAPKIAVNTFDGEQRAVSPKDIEYSPLWCGAADGDGSAYVVIEKVEHAGMHNAATSTVTTCSTGAAGAYAYTVDVGDEPCVRLIHRVCNGNGTVIGETLVRDVAFGTSSAPCTAIAADCRPESLQEAVNARKNSPVLLTYDTAWATNGAPHDVAISAVRLTGEGGSAIGSATLFAANAAAKGETPLRGISPGWMRLVCRVVDNGDATLLEYVTDDFLLKPLATTLFLR